MRLLNTIVLLIIATVALFEVSLQASTAAKRIIALSPHSVEMLFAIGAGDRIVATLEYSDYPEAALAIPRIGNYTGIQIEKIIELQPDLIIGWKSGNKQADLKKIKSLGFNLYLSQPKNILDISSELLKLGELTDLQENAKSIANDLDLQYQNIMTQYQHKKKVKTFYQLWHDPLRTVGANNWNQSLIKDCNGINVFDDASSTYPIVTLENVINKNPEVILIPHQSGTVDVKKDFWQKWQHIDAVKNNHIYSIDGDLVNRFGPRALQGLKLLCEAIDQARI